MTNEEFGNMLKKYEHSSRTFLTPKIPVIIRLDGRAFSNLTHRFFNERPFSRVFTDCMLECSKALLNEVDGAVLAYTQSDEISLLLLDTKNENTQPWFNYNVQKLVSITASICSSKFYSLTNIHGYFDSRAFNIQFDKVNDYFIWRQTDCYRNALSKFARNYFSEKQLNKKNTNDKLKMLNGININFDDIDNRIKFGTFISKVFKYSGNKYRIKFDKSGFIDYLAF